MKKYLFPLLLIQSLNSCFLLKKLKPDRPSKIQLQEQACKADKLNKAQAIERNRWAEHCYLIPTQKSKVFQEGYREEQITGRLDRVLVIYPTFTNSEGFNPEGFFAPKKRTAPCKIPKNYRVSYLCKATP